MDVEIKSDVKSVTVFPDRAMVTLEGSTELAEGHHQVIFTELPTLLDKDSVRVRGRAEMAMRLLGADVMPVYYEETPAEDIAQLIEEKTNIEDELLRLNDEGESLSAQIGYIDGLRQETDRFAQGLSRGKSSVEHQKELIAFLNEQDRDVKKAQRQVAFQKRELEGRLRKLQREIREKRSLRPKKRLKTAVGVEAESAGKAVFELTYLVSQAGWKPLYDLRLSAEDGNSAVELTAFAEISQETGQEWGDVELLVSTARPAIAQRMPELKPWYVDVYRPPMPVRFARSEPRPQAAPAEEEMSDLVMASPVDAAMSPAMMAAAEIEGGETMAATEGDSGSALSSATYRIKGTSNIPSDGSSHKKVITVEELAPIFDYLTIPKHTSAVFRRIRMSNGTAAPFLPGKANLFAHEEYIGSTELEYVPTGGELELLFGAEERIRVERELVKRDVDKARLRDKRQIRFGFEIEVENLMSERVELELQDQLPLSRHEDIKVRLEKSEPEPSEISDLNIIEWKLALDPGEKKTVQFSYMAEHPRDLQVQGLDIS